MTTLSHTNLKAHRFLTEEGAFIHTHYPASFEDIGDAESGPQISGGPAYDEYAGESHVIIIDETGLIVHSQEIDWDLNRFCEEMIAAGASEEDARDGYNRPRKAGEDWQISIRSEDGRLWLQRGQCWTDTRSEAHFFGFADASQRACRFNATCDARTWETSGAKLVHADECPRCLARKQPESKAECSLCGAALSQIGSRAPEIANKDAVQKALDLIRKAQADLGRKISDAERGDLLADNFNDWPLDFIHHVLADAKPLLRQPPKPKNTYTIELHESQRVMIALALRRMKELELAEYRAMADEPGYCFDTARESFDVLLEMFEELPAVELHNPGILHGFAS